MAVGTNIAAALVAFQKEMPTVHKGKTATVPTKAGGQYSYTYADLADVTAVAAPILTSHGLAFISHPEFVDGRPLLVGVLLHESGETIEGSLPLTGGTDQAMGSSLTYARRYLLGCLTGIVTDNDDDGAAATKSRARKKPAVESQSIPEPTQRMSRPAKTPRQSAESKMFALFKEAEITEKDAMLAFISDIAGRDVTSRTDLSDEELGSVVAELQLLKGNPS
jgi:hypothetical protein